MVSTFTGTEVEDLSSSPLPLLSKSSSPSKCLKTTHFSIFLIVLDMIGNLRRKDYLWGRNSRC